MSAKQNGFRIEAAHELDSSFILRDSRRFGTKVSDWLKKPENLGDVWLWCIVGLVFFPIAIPIVAIPATGLAIWQIKKYRFLRLPMRFPIWSRAMDPSGIDDNAMGDKKDGIIEAKGISFLGNQRKGMTVDGGEEIWASDSDIRVHKLIMATTGGGKTNTLVSWLANNISFGSGGMYVDGKAQNDIFTKIWGVCWNLWREDDVLVINYMSGDTDQFEEVLKKRTGKYKNRMSNSFNPFSFAPPDTINNLLQALNAKASGDGAMWQAKANNMTSGVVAATCFLRAKKEIQISAKTLRHYMALPNLIDLWRRPDIPEAAMGPVNAYLNVGLPGFNPKAAKEGKPQGQQTMDQHGFLSGQFAPVLGMLADIYDYIFSDVTPEVDVTDCVYKNRILVVLIPSLRKSEQEAASLGKIVVSAAKMMMGANLGSAVEGEINEIVNNRPTNCDEPYEIILDELGYYFAPGIDLMFAQGRSLGIGLTASGQDFQAMAKGENKNAVESMIANTRMKIALAMEDPKETYDIFAKSAGEAYVTKVSRFERNEGMMGKSSHMRGSDEASIDKQSRISLEELRALGPGDGVILYKSKVIRVECYNIYSDFREDESAILRLNTMLPISRTSFQEIMHLCKDRNDVPASIRIGGIFMSGSAPRYISGRSEIGDRIICSAQATAELIDDLDSSTPPAARGIAMFQSIVRELRRTSVEESPEKAGVLESNQPTVADMNGQSPVTGRQMARKREVAHELSPSDFTPDSAKRELASFDPLSFLDDTPIEMNNPTNSKESADEAEMTFGATKAVRLSSSARQSIESISEMVNPDSNPVDVSSDIENMINSAVDYTMQGFAEQSSLGGDGADLMDVDAIMAEFAALEKLARGEQAT